MALFLEDYSLGEAEDVLTLFVAKYLGSCNLNDLPKKALVFGSDKSKLDICAKKLLGRLCEKANEDPETVVEETQSLALSHSLAVFTPVKNELPGRKSCSQSPIFSTQIRSKPVGDVTFDLDETLFDQDASVHQDDDVVWRRLGGEAPVDLGSRGCTKTDVSGTHEEKPAKYCQKQPSSPIIGASVSRNEHDDFIGTRLGRGALADLGSKISRRLGGEALADLGSRGCTKVKMFVNAEVKPWATPGKNCKPKASSTPRGKKVRKRLTEDEEFNKVESPRTRLMKEVPTHRHITKAVRTKKERRALTGFSCPDCRKYYAQMSPRSRRVAMDRCQKHRAKFPPTEDSPQEPWRVTISETLIPTQPHTPLKWTRYARKKSHLGKAAVHSAIKARAPKRRGNKSQKKQVVTNMDLDLDLSAHGLPKKMFGMLEPKKVLPLSYKKFAEDLAESMRHHGADPKWTKQVEDPKYIARQMTTKGTEVKKVVMEFQKKMAKAGHLGNLRHKQELELALVRYMIGPRGYVSAKEQSHPSAPAAARGKAGGVRHADLADDDASQAGTSQGGYNNCQRSDSDDSQHQDHDHVNDDAHSRFGDRCDDSIYNLDEEDEEELDSDDSLNDLIASDDDFEEEENGQPTYVSQDVGRNRKRTAKTAGLEQDPPEDSDSDPDAPKKPRRGGEIPLPESSYDKSGSFNVSIVQEDDVVEEDGAVASGEVAAEDAETGDAPEEGDQRKVQEDGDGGDLI